MEICMRVYCSLYFSVARALVPYPSRSLRSLKTKMIPFHPQGVLDFSQYLRLEHLPPNFSCAVEVWALVSSPFSSFIFPFRS